jgi:hypothetical protein
MSFGRFNRIRYRWPQGRIPYEIDTIAFPVLIKKSFFLSFHALTDI